MQHDWIPSTLGHGETMCRRCFGTNRELAALGMLNECDAPEPAPAAANENDFEDHLADCIDLDDGDEDAEAEMNCGEMPDGGCSLAGTEYCDWHCPFSDGMSRRMQAKK